MSKRTFEGIVVGGAMNKTRVVVVERFKINPIYHKISKTTRRFKAHDEENQYQNGDRVLVEESRPISRQKRWKIVKLVSRPINSEASIKEEVGEVNNK